jgi:MFS family permease
MNWDELSGIWRGQPEDRSRGTDLPALEVAFASRQRQFARQLFWRDVREAATAALMAFVFGYLGWRMGPAGWPMVVAVVLLLGVGGFFVWERRRARQASVGAEAPLSARVEAEIAEQEHQRRLLLTVGWWYLAPTMAAATLLALSVLVHAPIPWAARLLAGGLMAAVIAPVAWWVHALNRRVVRDSIEPHLQELETLRAVLKSGE